HLTAMVGVAVSDDERLARCISEFFEAANQERDDQCRKTSRQQQTDGEKREHDEGHDHEWLPAVPIRVVRGGKNAYRGSEHFYGGEDAHLPTTDTDVIHREDHDPGVGNPFAKADQDVA